MKKILSASVLVLLFAVVLPAASVSSKVPVPPFLKMALPEVIYAVPGIETNLYFENVIESATPEAYAFEVRCKVGAQKQHRWHWTPTEKDAGKTFDLTLTLFNDCGVIMSGNCKVVVAAKAPDMKKKITLAMLAASGVNS